MQSLFTFLRLIGTILLFIGIRGSQAAFHLRQPKAQATSMLSNPQHPCGGLSVSSPISVMFSNATEFPIAGHPFCVVTNNTEAIWSIQAGRRNNMTRLLHMSPAIIQTGHGYLCIPALKGLEALRWSQKGDEAVIQVRQITKDDDIHYQCAVVKFVDGEPAPVDPNECFNSTGVMAKLADEDLFGETPITVPRPGAIHNDRDTPTSKIDGITAITPVTDTPSPPPVPSSSLREKLGSTGPIPSDSTGNTHSTSHSRGLAPVAPYQPVETVTIPLSFTTLRLPRPCGDHRPAPLSSLTTPSSASSSLPIDTVVISIAGVTTASLPRPSEDHRPAVPSSPTTTSSTASLPTEVFLSPRPSPPLPAEKFTMSSSGTTTSPPTGGVFLSPRPSSSSTSSPPPAQEQPTITTTLPISSVRSTSTITRVATVTMTGKDFGPGITTIHPIDETTHDPAITTVPLFPSGITTIIPVEDDGPSSSSSSPSLLVTESWTTTTVGTTKTSKPAEVTSGPSSTMTTRSVWGEGKGSVPSFLWGVVAGAVVALFFLLNR